MKVKRFVALDMRSALSQIREEFSADAVILSSRNITGGGVEVLAAYNEAEAGQRRPAVAPLRAVEPAGPSGTRDRPSTPQQTPGRPKADFARVQQQLAQSVSTPYLDALKDQQFSLQGRSIRKSLADAAQAPEPPARPAVEPLQRPAPAVNDPAVGELRSELSGIRNLLEQRLSSLNWEQFARRTPVQAHVWERLNSMGIPGFLSKQLLEKIPAEASVDDAWRFALALLTRSVPVAGDDLVSRGGTFALLGPTGAGKTTTIGKLAGRYVLEHGSEGLALVTTDSYRVAAHEQLRAFGRILGVSVRVVDEKHSLAQTLHSLRDKRLVLIDSAGFSTLAANMQQQLAELRGQQQVRNLLVLPCTSQGQVLRTVMKTWSGLQLAGCILTRLDEAASMGDALALAVDHKLPIAYETFGQSIPDDIRVAQASRLVSRAVSLSRQAETDREQLMSDYASNFLSATRPVSLAGQRSV